MADSHTKGPWKSYKDGVHPVLENGSSGNDHFAICQCFGPDALRNQRLIAAAPELLKACSDWIDWLKPDSPWREDAADHETRMLDAMRAAISKATSRQPEGER